MRPPRETVPYADRAGHCPVLDQLDQLDDLVALRVRAKLRVLESYDWPDLFGNQLVKELKGGSGILEFRVAGSGPFGVRITFFATACRGRNEVVLLDCEKRGNLSGLLWKRFIARAERLRDDWERRHCGRKDAH